MLDTYNQQIQEEVSCTIRTNINTANHHFIVEECNSKENISTPTKVSTGMSQIDSTEDNLGGGISRTVKTTDSLATLIMEENIVEPLNPYKDGTCRTIKAQYQQSSRANFARQDGLGATGVVQIGNIYPDTDTFKNRTMGRVYSNEGLSPTINCCGGGDREPKIVEDWQTIVGNKQLNPFRGSVEGTSPCITSACGAGGGMTPMLTDADLETTKTKEFIEQVRGHEDMRYRIRKLTPRECFRLMGVDDADIDKIQASGISNSQQYKCAGNSIVVDVLYHIFRKMFCETENENDQLCLF
jgi:DNA (cytosine-5)-methyltransferase 1